MFNYFEKIDDKEKSIILKLLIFFVIFCVLSYGKWGHEVIDCFRNAYVPEQILTGKALYKDVHFFYGPLVMYFHALLFMIFGVNLTVLYIIGIILSLGILILMYYLSRQLLEPYQAALLIFLMMVQSVFRPGIYQYFFPYSYESLYSLFIVLCILLILVSIVNNEFINHKKLYIAAGLVSLLPVIKQDIAVSGYLIFYVFIVLSVIFKRINLKSSLLYVLIPVILPLIIYYIFSLFIPFTDIYDAITLKDRLAQNFITDLGNINQLLNDGLTVLRLFLFELMAVLVILIVSYFLNKFSFDKFKSHQPAMLIAINIFCILLVLLNKNAMEYFPFKQLYSWNIYTWIVVFLLIYLICVLFDIFKNRKHIDKTEQILILFIVAAIFCLYRTFYPSLNYYSNLFIFPAILVLVFFLYNVVPDIFKNIDKKHYHYAVNFLIVLVSFLMLLQFMSYYLKRNLTIKTDRGTIQLDYKRGKQIKKTIELINELTSKNDVIFTAPDESIFYFLASRQGATKYYQLLPNIMTMEKHDDEVIEHLKTNMPSLVIISNNENVAFYNKKGWGVDYNQKVYLWIKENYRLNFIVQSEDEQSKEMQDYKIYIYTKK